jgi:hypothetical protein
VLLAAEGYMASSSPERDVEYVLITDHAGRHGRSRSTTS